MITNLLLRVLLVVSVALVAIRVGDAGIASPAPMKPDAVTSPEVQATVLASENCTGCLGQHWTVNCPPTYAFDDSHLVVSSGTCSGTVPTCSSLPCSISGYVDVINGTTSPVWLYSGALPPIKVPGWGHVVVGFGSGTKLLCGGYLDLDLVSSDTIDESTVIATFRIACSWCQ